MPLLEAFIDETQVMRYKLFTADKDLPTLATLGTLSTPQIGDAGDSKEIGQLQTIMELMNFTLSQF